MRKRTPKDIWVKSLQYTSMLAIAVSISACGGSSDDDDDSTGRFEGHWSGALTRTSDSCSTGSLGSTANFQHQVVQNGGAIQLVDGDGNTFLGNVVGSDGFSVDAVFPSSRGSTCQQQRRIEYNRITDDDDDTADVDYTIQEVCSGQEACSILFTGTASRTTNGSTPTPAPTAVGTVTPGPTPTPVAGTRSGCQAMNPNTIAGTYEGTGGCGISDVRFTFDNPNAPGAITLAPFGGNGAITFAISSAQPSTATSTRSDLTIQGQQDNTCMMACSPPGTFTVTCASASGFQCSEKF